MAPQRCDCDRGFYDDGEYGSCYECFIDRREHFTSCIYCDRWHAPQFDTCFRCRPRGRDEAAHDLKILILARDSFRCRYCGAEEGDERLDPRKVSVSDSGQRRVSLHIDHILPCARGGTADQWNLQVLCGVCNISKGSTWYRGCRHEQARSEVVEAYLTYLWIYLTRDEKDRLLLDAGLDEMIGRL